jgi:hypothetical protein
MAAQVPLGVALLAGVVAGLTVFGLGFAPFLLADELRYRRDRRPAAGQPGESE